MNGRNCPHSAGFRPPTRAGKRMSRLAGLAEGERFELSVQICTWCSEHQIGAPRGTHKRRVSCPSTLRTVLTSTRRSRAIASWPFPAARAVRIERSTNASADGLPESPRARTRQTIMSRSEAGRFVAAFGAADTVVDILLNHLSASALSTPGGVPGAAFPGPGGRCGSIPARRSLRAS